MRESFNTTRWIDLNHKGSEGSRSEAGYYASVQALWAGPFLMAAMGLSPYMTGNLLLAMSIGLIIGSPICGWISDRILLSRKYVIITGLVTMAGILIILSVLPKGTWLLILFAFVFFGVSLVLTALLYGLTVDVKKNHGKTT